MDKLVGVLIAIHYDLALIAIMSVIRVIYCIISLLKDE